ncbi:hypothetical protein [Bacillus litorisediminis]|uniref:hypothetical protein n=1 Tax=Bacillus litorisediminis TaxID=2922713 RepID=UPI001FAF6DBD|nr:hypothetical protein [Bacillus litorisediminis]
MNKVEDLQEVNNLLNEFIEAIHFYDKDEAIALYEKVKLIEREGLDQEVIDRLDLFLYRYFIFIHDYEKSKEYGKELHSRFDSLSTENQVIFNTYDCVAKIVNVKIAPAIEKFHSILDDNNNNLPDFILSDIYYHLCWGYVYVDDYKRSIIYGNKALDLYISEFNLLRIIYTQMLLAICHINLGFYEESEEIYKHLIRNAKLLNMYHLIPHIEYNQCASLVKAGHYSRAIEQTRKVLEILEKYDKDNDVLHLMTLISLVEAKLMNREKDEVKELLERVKKTSNKNAAYKKWYLIAIYYEKKLSSEYDALNYLKETLAPFLLDSNDKKALFDITKVMGDYFVKQRNYELASNYYELNLSLN